MKITSFNPILYTSGDSSILETFEALGFETSHVQGDKNVNTLRMKDDNGHYMDIAHSNTLNQLAIRINVDDFKEAYDLLIEKGFKDIQGIEENEKTISCLLASSSLLISLQQHKKL